MLHLEFSRWVLSSLKCDLCVVKVTHGAHHKDQYHPPASRFKKKLCFFRTGFNSPPLLPFLLYLLALPLPSSVLSFLPPFLPSVPRAGVLQVGDRIVSLNGVNVDGVATAHQALKLVQEGGDVLDMEVIFDVTGNLDTTLALFLHYVCMCRILN